MLGVLRTDDPGADLAPQPELSELDALLDRVRAHRAGREPAPSRAPPFPLGGAAELTAYRIVQEALTNTIRHATAQHARVKVSYDSPVVQIGVTDDGTPPRTQDPGDTASTGCRRRAALHHGVLHGGARRVGRMARRRPPCSRANPLRPVLGMSIIVLLVDDQALMRRGFRMILEAEEDLAVSARPATATRPSISHARNPDVVLMDIRMPGTDGIEATRRIIAADTAVRVLVLTTFDLDEYAFGALRAGASGFLLKDVARPISWPPSGRSLQGTRWSRPG